MGQVRFETTPAGSMNEPEVGCGTSQKHRLFTLSHEEFGGQFGQFPAAPEVTVSHAVALQLFIKRSVRDVEEARAAARQYTAKTAITTQRIISPRNSVVIVTHPLVIADGRRNRIRHCRRLTRVL